MTTIYQVGYKAGITHKKRVRVMFGGVSIVFNRLKKENGMPIRQMGIYLSEIILYIDMNKDGAYL